MTELTEKQAKCLALLKQLFEHNDLVPRATLMNAMADHGITPEIVNKVIEKQKIRGRQGLIYSRPAQFLRNDVNRDE